MREILRQVLYRVDSPVGVTGSDDCRLVDTGTAIGPGKLMAAAQKPPFEHAPKIGSTAYAVAKHGLGGLTKQLAVELGRYGITANSVAPGAVATPMTGLEDEDPSHHPRPTFPIPRPGDAREIASCIAWLCSTDAGWTTGASFVVDGGFLLVNPSARPDRM